MMDDLYIGAAHADFVEKTQKDVLELEEDVYSDMDDDFGFEVSYVDEAVDIIDDDFDDTQCFKTLSDVQKMLADEIEELRNELNIADEDAACLLLRHFKWNAQEAARQYRLDPARALEQARIRVDEAMTLAVGEDANCNPTSEVEVCATCNDRIKDTDFRSPNCGHQFCGGCWTKHVKSQMENVGRFADICCMEVNCDIILGKKFVLKLISPDEQLVARYQQFRLNDLIFSHPQLRYCPGKECGLVIRSKDQQAEGVTCKSCNTNFCWRCQGEYHAPASCAAMAEWKTVVDYIQEWHNCEQDCEDIEDSNRVEYPNGDYLFCWTCHGTGRSCGDYRCTRSTISSDQAKAKAEYDKCERRWYKFEHHVSCRRLEKQRRIAINAELRRILEDDDQLIEYNYLDDAFAELARVRRVLQYTYPLVHYLKGVDAHFIEFKQEMTEKIVNDLSNQLRNTSLDSKNSIKNLVAVLKKVDEKFFEK